MTENLSTRLTRVEDECRARKRILKAADSYYPRTLAALGVVAALLWGYFEFRVYPEIIQAQQDVKELRKEVYTFMLEKQGRGALWGIGSAKDLKKISEHATKTYEDSLMKSLNTVIVPSPKGIEKKRSKTLIF